jgi:hypothetical protein
MKVLLSWPYAQGEYNDPPDIITVLLPTRALFERLLGLMRKAEELEKQIVGFIRMDIQDWIPLFVDADRLRDSAMAQETGQFHEVELKMTTKKLEAMAEVSVNARIDHCVAFVEKERVGWEFYVKYWDVPCYTGTLDRKYVEKQL